MKRTFIAADVYAEPHLREAFDKIHILLQAEQIAWVNPLQLHITIQFLGDTTEEIIPTLIKTLTPVIANSKPFAILIQDIGVFKNIDDPRVLWLGCVIPDIMMQIHNHVIKATAVHGYKVEDRPFRPHLTLGRIKGKLDKKNLVKVLDCFRNKQFQSQQVKELKLYESRLTSSGAIYAPIHSFRLGGV